VDDAATAKLIARIKMDNFLRMNPPMGGRSASIPQVFPSGDCEPLLPNMGNVSA
jgi:hypothetical protein